LDVLIANAKKMDTAKQLQLQELHFGGGNGGTATMTAASTSTMEPGKPFPIRCWMSLPIDPINGEFNSQSKHKRKERKQVDPLSNSTRRLAVTNTVENTTYLRTY
jgi:hypothetical protein